MTGDRFPDVAELVPHSGSMLLVGRVVEHSDERTVCEIDPARSGPFVDAEGRVPAWVALEYMAQCAAVHGGLSSRERGTPPRPGMLLGTRRLRLEADHFRTGQNLLASVVCVHFGAQMLSFDGEVREAEGRVLAQARFNVYMADIPDEIET